MAYNHTVEIEQAQVFLTRHLGTAPAAITRLGEGAWSRCYGFAVDGQELVIRFGQYVSDFRKDQRAHAYAGPDLPVPEVLEIGRALGGYYAISTRVTGIPLEMVSAAQWRRLVPAVVAALEAMRAADLSKTEGYGGWDAAGHAPYPDWRTRLLSVAEDRPDQRGHGWHAALATCAEGQATFDWGLSLLDRVADEGVPRSLVHGDLTNRNVLVEGDEITGVFDWGCAIYGDALYDLACFEFWAPWQPTLDTGALRAALEERWAAQGYRPENQDARLEACYLHIGLEHLAYNAQLGDWTMLLAVAQRMRALVPETLA